MSRYQDEFEMMKTKVQILDKASLKLNIFSPDIINKISEFKNKYNKFESEIDGNPAKAEIGEWDKVTLSTRVQIAMQGLSTSYGPTDLNSSNLEIAEKLFEELKVNIQNLKSELDSLEKEVKELNPPHLSGSGIN